MARSNISRWNQLQMNSSRGREAQKRAFLDQERKKTKVGTRYKNPLSNKEQQKFNRYQSNERDRAEVSDFNQKVASRGKGGMAGMAGSAPRSVKNALLQQKSMERVIRSGVREAKRIGRPGMAAQYLDYANKSGLQIGGIREAGRAMSNAGLQLEGRLMDVMKANGTANVSSTAARDGTMLGFQLGGQGSPGAFGQNLDGSDVEPWQGPNSGMQQRGEDREAKLRADGRSKLASDISSFVLDGGQVNGEDYKGELENISEIEDYNNGFQVPKGTMEYGASLGVFDDDMLSYLDAEQKKRKDDMSAGR